MQTLAFKDGLAKPWASDYILYGFTDKVTYSFPDVYHTLMCE